MLVECIHVAWWINIENSVSILNIERYYICMPTRMTPYDFAFIISMSTKEITRHNEMLCTHENTCNSKNIGELSSLSETIVTQDQKIVPICIIHEQNVRFSASVHFI